LVLNIAEEIKRFIEELMKKDQKACEGISVEPSPQVPGLFLIFNKKYPNCPLRVLEDAWKKGDGKKILENDYNSWWLHPNHNHL
jgi:hypothetical protein